MANLDRISVELAQYYTTWETKSSHYLVQTPSGVLYFVYISHSATNYQDVVYRKSTDRGVTWGAEVVLKACFGTLVSVWADWWSGITATSYIHVAYTDSGTDDTFYRYIDTANSDTLGTERTVFAGSSTANGGTLSITRARGGNLMCATCIDAGAEYDTVKSTDLFVNKTSISEVFEGATYDQVILAPNPDSADNQDILAFFWDSSADEISLKKYDDSGDSWSESSIATSMVDVVSAWYNQYNIGVDLTNNNIVLVAWSGCDSANADLRCWICDDSAVTETASNIVLNSTDDQGFCCMSICPNNVWYAFYIGKSDGSEIAMTSTNIYYKISTDQGATWGSETAATYLATTGFNALFGVPYSYSPIPSFASLYIKSGSTDSSVLVNIPIPIQPRASFQLGM